MGGITNKKVEKWGYEVLLGYLWSSPISPLVAFVFGVCTFVGCLYSRSLLILMKFMVASKLSFEFFSVALINITKIS